MLYSVQMSENCPIAMPGAGLNKSFIRLVDYFERAAPAYKLAFQWLTVYDEDNPYLKTTTVMKFKFEDGSCCTVSIIEEEP